MKLIKAVSVKGFRSLARSSVDDLGGMTVIVGKNSTGKSNLLRALNLFFNGVPATGETISFPRDHFDRPTRRQKKQIEVSVTFSLPGNVHFRAQLQHLAALGQTFRITRRWELDAQRRPFESLELVGHGEDKAAWARQFLNLVTYRYIPNRTIPAALLKDESQALANAIFMRMKGDTHAKATLKSLGKAAARLLKDADQSLKSTGAPLTAATLATAGTLGEMIKMAGFEARGPHGGVVQAEEWGHGHQAYFLYEILHALDTNYGQFFGWKQATVWGVEEPESGLHRDLETRLAGRFRHWSNDAKSKLQIISTTHSPIIAMASDVTYWADLTDGSSVILRRTVQEVVKQAEMEGVSGWVHPVLAFPWNPVVLVEGGVDSRILNHVASLAGMDHLRFLPLPELDKLEKGGGKNSIISYLRRMREIIRNRPKAAPLVVLLDWEVSSTEMTQAREAYGEGGSRFVLKMDPRHCAKELGTDFRGIERFYPVSIITAAQADEEILLGHAKGRPYSVSSSQLDGAKGKLLNRALRIKDADRFEPLLGVLRDVENAIQLDRPAQVRLPVNDGGA